MTKYKKGQQRLTKIKPFINKYKWEVLNFPSEKKNDRKRIEKNNVAITLNVLYAKKYKTYSAYVSKYN